VTPLERAERIAGLALEAVAREYPSHLHHVMQDDRDARPPRQLTPAFFGSFDWHSAVHGHWCLARLARRFPRAGFVVDARAALDRSLTPANIAGELAYLGGPGREGFERPYGLAWLLQLAAELREWDDRDAARWRAALAPLEALAAGRLRAGLARLPWPVRAGVHAQTAFALGLALDWARAAAARDFESQIVERARAFFVRDVDAPIRYEPSGHDFLSPILGEADLMRRVLAPGEYGAWLEGFLPDLESAEAARWLTPVASPDRADGQLSHLDGLNLSRAWMLLGIASALPEEGRRGNALKAGAERHAAAGLAAVTGEHYAGSHWLGSFAAYLMTGRGLAEPAPG
jgi:hypothetical protein